MRRIWILVGCALLWSLVSGCRLYGRVSGKSSYRPPQRSVESSRDEAGKPIVLLIPGSMIVSDFFDVLEQRLAGDGYRPIVYQPRDLLTSAIPEIAEEIGQAVDIILRETGETHLRILAECNGGVAARYYVTRLGGYQYVDRFVSFVSAHHGTGSFSIAWYPALRDIKASSDYVQDMEGVGLPEGATTEMVSIYFCDDEIMEPPETSMIPDALNIGVCDERVAERARDRERYKVHHLLGAVMIPMFPVHFAGFWDETLYRLFRLALEEDFDTIRGFDGYQAEFVEGRPDQGASP